MTKWHQIPDPCTGDATRCQRCACFLNIHSPKERIGDNLYRWRCEFCNEVNDLDLDEEELPKSSSELYILSGAPMADTQTPQDADQQDQSSVIFCLDISGSMNVKTSNVSRLDCVK
mmetsp:Transcript_9892/g.1464  ORF Transcript_9892/g.1464 Transcript_9892/m.1464 type:complete len:116 (-) Transcript_9892:1261-1608(-)